VEQTLLNDYNANALRPVILRPSLVGDAKSSLGDAKSSLGDAKSSLGDAESSLGDAKSSLGDAESSPGDAESSLGDVKRRRWTRLQVYEVSLPKLASLPPVAAFILGNALGIPGVDRPVLVSPHP
jgi:hypothetical protein